MKILLVEDETTICEVIAAYLTRAGHTVVDVDDGEKASKKIEEEKFDLIILDLNLPKKDGLTLCKEIREQDSSTPILMVTARTEELDEITGLELGADDYIKKPFSPSVLVARVESLLRRVAPSIIHLGKLSIDQERMQVHKGDESIELTSMQFDILKTLAEKPGQVFTRDDLLERVYKDGLSSNVLDRTIDAHIKSIRKAIEDNPKEPEYILTVVGKGYKSNAEI